MIPEGQEMEVNTIDEVEHTFGVKVRSPVQTTTNGVKTETQTEVQNGA